MVEYKLITFLFYFSYFILSSQKFIIIPFKVVRKENNINEKFKYNSKSNLLSLIEQYYFQATISSIIPIESKNKYIIAEYNINNNNFSINNNCISNEFFQQFNELSQNNQILGNKNNKSYINESLFVYSNMKNFEKNNFIEIKNLIINYPCDVQKCSYNYCLSIGLQINDHQNFNILPSFIEQIKEKYIDKYLLTLYFNKENNNSVKNEDGIIILGEYPHNINNYIKNKKIKYSYSSKKNDTFSWGMNFDNIYYNISFKNENYLIKYMSDILSVEFNINMDFILGTNEYKNLIIKDFFQEYFTKDICKKIIFKNIYEIILCNSDVFLLNNLKKFPSLIFQNKKDDIYFEFNYQDLFDLIYGGNYYIFLVFFKLNYYKTNNFKWYFGINFFKKYLTIFDYDKKIIGFYSDEKNNINQKFKII